MVDISPRKTLARPAGQGGREYKMRIINGKRFHKADMDKAVRIDGGGWNKYNGQNYQWYFLCYEPQTGYVELDADNSGDCYGDYTNRYFDSPKSFLAWCNRCDRNWAKLLGDIDEDDKTVMDFVDKILA